MLSVTLSSLLNHNHANSLVKKQIPDFPYYRISNPKVVSSAMKFFNTKNFDSLLQHVESNFAPNCKKNCKRYYNISTNLNNVFVVEKEQLLKQLNCMNYIVYNNAGSYFQGSGSIAIAIAF
jgi:hypothetical protein